MTRSWTLPLPDRIVALRSLVRGSENGGLASPRVPLLAGALLLLVYSWTLAPGVTFWDAGEFIAAAQGFGIPHPPGTPLYVALGRSWIATAGWLLGSARAMNEVSAVCTAAAGGLTAWVIACETRGSEGSAWGAVAGAITAGLLCSVWANATETEVYAVSLLHVSIMLACAVRAGGDGGARWLAMTAYVIALAPAVHLSALVAAPAAIAMAARDRHHGWSVPRLLLLSGVLVVTAGLGRMSPALMVAGGALMLSGALGARSSGAPTVRVGSVVLLVSLAASALLIMLVRARHDPTLNQGNPDTLSALADVVARRQYAVAGLLPRQAPMWLQAVNVAQYADWQVAMGWGRGIFTSPARVCATVAYIALGVLGWHTMRRDAARLAVVLSVLVVCGSAGVAAYLNMKAGASLGWGVLPDAMPHEARERDYFFVLSFWGWGCFAGWGALAVARRMRAPRLALLAALVPLVANWHSNDRSTQPEASAARLYAVALLATAPPGAVLFTAGDNDSYPLWYLQQVEGVRTDVQLVTLPLLPAKWYGREIARRTGWRWNGNVALAGARWQHENEAAGIARAAADAGRPVMASAAVTARERGLLGSHWTLRGAAYLAGARATGLADLPQVDSVISPSRARRSPAELASHAGLPDDVTAMMLGLLDCPRLGATWRVTPAERDSLESRCNFR